MPCWLTTCRRLLAGASLLATIACEGSGSQPMAADAGDASSRRGPDGQAGQDNQDAGGALYPRVRALFERSCAYERCHSGSIIGGALDLSRGRDYIASLVGVPACEYPAMSRIEPHSAQRSWLMVKLTAPFRRADDPYANYIEFSPEAGWDPAQRGCPDQTEDGQALFGQRMPLTAPNMLPDAELELLRAWIDRGASRDD